MKRERKFITQTTYSERCGTALGFEAECRILPFVSSFRLHKIVRIFPRWRRHTGLAGHGKAWHGGWRKQQWNRYRFMKRTHWANNKPWRMFNSRSTPLPVLPPSTNPLSVYGVFKVCKSEWLFNLLTAPFSACFVRQNSFEFCRKRWYQIEDNESSVCPLCTLCSEHQWMNRKSTFARCLSHTHRDRERYGCTVQWLNKSSHWWVPCTICTLYCTATEQWRRLNTEICTWILPAAMQHHSESQKVIISAVL